MRSDQKCSPELINRRVKAYFSRLDFLRLFYIDFMCFNCMMIASNAQMPFDCFWKEQGDCLAGKEQRHRTTRSLLCLVWMGRCSAVDLIAEFWMFQSGNFQEISSQKKMM